MSYLLEIAIPTFNRSELLRKCLESVAEAVEDLPETSRSKILVSVSDNSNDVPAARRVVDDFAHRLNTRYTCTGRNIGSIANIVACVLNAVAEYVWVLPDDDFVDCSALTNLLPILVEERPSFVITNTRVVTYFSENVIDTSWETSSPYRVFPGVTALLEEVTLADLLGQLRHVYEVSAVREFYLRTDVSGGLNEFLPVFHALIAANAGTSIAIPGVVAFYRAGDNSPWRSQWTNFRLFDWPEAVAAYVRLGLLGAEREAEAQSLYVESVAGELRTRPDLLLGRSPSVLNPIRMFRHYPLLYGRLLGVSVLGAPRTAAKLAARRIARLRGRSPQPVAHRS